MQVRWNSTVVKFDGETVQVPGAEEGDPTTEQDTLSKVQIKNIVTGEMSELTVAAAFVAIGHDPNTNYIEGVTKDEGNYVTLKGDGSTYTSKDGVFACGDVADKVYRQASPICTVFIWPLLRETLVAAGDPRPTTRDPRPACFTK